MKSKKILILVMNSDLYPSTTIVPILKKTFLSKPYIQLNLGHYEFPNFKESRINLFHIDQEDQQKSIPKITLLDHEKELKLNQIEY